MQDYQFAPGISFHYISGRVWRPMYSRSYRLWSCLDRTSVGVSPISPVWLV